MKNKIILFSDLHCGVDVKNKAGKVGTNTFGDLEAELLKLKNEIDNISPEFTVNLGDVISYTSLEQDKVNYNKFLKIFNLENIYHVYGNHDLNNIGMENLENMTGQAAKYSFLTGNVRHVILDSIRTDKVYLSRKSITWLKDNLNKENETVILYNHYPITLDDDNVSYYHKGREEICFVNEAKELQDILKESNCVAVISGHTHFYYNKDIDGIKYITIPSFSESVYGYPSLEYAIFDYKTLEIEIKKITI